MLISNAMIQEALRYMQMPQDKADDDIIQKIRATYNELEQIKGTRAIYKVFSIYLEPQAIFLENTQLKIESQDLLKLLSNCQRCYILAVTLGQEVDRKITIKQKIDMLDAVILDACASVCIDRVCDDLEREIVKELKDDEFLTMRFSPGYGDVLLEVQQKLLDILDASRKIGISLTKTNMLIPTKSITALIGVSNQKENRLESCSKCNLTQVCLYKKRGDRCGL